MLESQLMLRP